jgi:PAS domain S-box-containing protein
MWDTLRRLSAPPALEGDEDKHRLAVFSTLLWSFILLLALYTLIALPLLVARKLAVLAIVALLVGIWVGVRALLQAGRFRLAALVWLTTLWALTTFLTLFAGGVRSNVSAFYLSIPVLAGLLLGPRGALAAVGFCGLTAAALAGLEVAGRLPDPYFPNPPGSAWAYLVFAMSWTVTPLNAAVRNLRQALAAARKQVAERTRVETALAERTRQLEAVRAVAEEITREMRLPALLELIVERAARLVGAAGGSVMLWDESGSVLVPGVWVGRAPETRASQIALFEGVTGTVAAQRKGLIVNDYRNSPLARPAMLERTPITATIAEPLLYQDRLVGVINLDNGDTHLRFTEQHQEVLRLYAAQAAIAIENARLYAIAERDRREAEILASLAQKLNGSLDLDVVLQEVAGGARELCESDFVELVMRDPGQETLRLHCVAGRRLEDHPPLIVEPGKGMGGAILATGQPFRTSNYAEDPRLGKEHLARVQAMGVMAEIGVPILIDGRIEGIIYADNCRPCPFNDRDEATLIRLAEQAAVAIRNARLYEATQRELADRLRAEEALRQSETRYRTLFESAEDAIFLMHGERFLDCNPPSLRLFGCLPEDLLGETPWRFSPACQADGRDSADSAREKIRAAMLGTPQRFEWRHCRLDGTPFDAEVSLNRLLLDGQSLLLAMVRDITQRKHAEQRLQESREQFRALSSHLESLREEERTRVAREIHDHLGQLLTALKLDLRTIERRISDISETDLRSALSGKVASATGLADETITSVQKIASALRPGVLDRLGLASAIEVEAQAFQSRTGVQCEWSLPRDPVAIPPDHATAVFRIFQEILTNVARHAHATRASVRLSREGTDLVLQVRDDGVGIRESDIQNPESLGLLGMRERATILGGTVTIRGSAGQGTTVTVRIPPHGRNGPTP